MRSSILMLIVMGGILAPMAPHRSMATTRAPVPPALASAAQLRQALIQFGQDDASPAAIRGLGQPLALARVEDLARVTPTDDALYYYAAFTLAYFGRSYRRNVRALSAPIELLSKDYVRYHDRYVAIGGVPFDPREEGPDLLVRLYDHNRDRQLLKLLFSFALDGLPPHGLPASGPGCWASIPRKCWT